MVTEQILHDYDMACIEDYFDYIMESKYNGQNKQARELFNALSDGMQGQRADFFNYLETMHFFDGSTEELNEFISSLKKFFSWN